MIEWLTGRKRHLEEVRAVCEIAMSHLGVQASVHAARLCDSSVPGMRYLVMLDMPDPIRPGVLLSLRGYLSAEIRAALGVAVGPSDLVVVPIDLARAQLVSDRTSREDVLASQIYADSHPSAWP